MIANAVVKFVTRLHRVDHGFLVSVTANRLIHVLGRLVRGAKRGQRVKHDPATGALQLFNREQRRLTEFGDVGEYRHFDRINKFAIRRQVVGGFGEDAVGTCLHAFDCALDGCVHAMNLNGVGAGDQEKIRIGFCVGGGFHAVHHFVGGDDLFARTMAAALGADLVFNMARRCAKFDQRFHRARDVERARAEAGVDVHHQRQVAHVGDAPHVGKHIIEIVDAEVRQAERARCNAAARQVNCFKARAFGKQSVVGVDGANHL